MDLSEIDLNQLVLFHQLMLERSVSRAAENLGLTQPAVSNSLAKLRRKLGDDLFVRTSAGMVPTPYAEQLAEPVGYALDMIRDGLNQRSDFDPSQVRRALTIGMTDIGEIVFLPEILKRLKAEAPLLTLNTVRNAPGNLREAMELGHVDLAIGPMSHLTSGFFQKQLFSQKYVCLFRRGHELDGKRISIDDFQRAEHLLIVSAGTIHGQIDDLMLHAGIKRNVRLTIPHFTSVGHILRSTDLVATVTETLAGSLVEPFGLAYQKHPVKLPEVGIKVFWHAKVHRSPLHQWLRTTIAELFADGPV